MKIWTEININRSGKTTIVNLFASEPPLCRISHASLIIVYWQNLTKTYSWPSVTCFCFIYFFFFVLLCLDFGKKKWPNSLGFWNTWEQRKDGQILKVMFSIITIIHFRFWIDLSQPNTKRLVEFGQVASLFFSIPFLLD